jgi:hypothetical protein
MNAGCPRGVTSLRLGATQPGLARAIPGAGFTVTPGHDLLRVRVTGGPEPRPAFKLALNSP